MNVQRGHEPGNNVLAHGPARWLRAPRLTLLIVTTLLLGACSSPPVLSTSADEVRGTAFEGQSITVRNAGGGVLHWNVTTDNPHVILTNQLGETITGGSLVAGRSSDLRIRVQGRVVDPAVGLNATLFFESNGGASQVQFSAGTTGSCTPSPTPAAATSGPVPVGNEILVSYRLPRTTFGPASAGTSSALTQQATAARTELIGAYGLRTVEAANGAGPDVLSAPAGEDVDALVARLASDPRVAAVQRNYYVELQWNGGAPTDPLYTAQWSLSQFGVPEAWAALSGGAAGRVVLAVLDSGIDTRHPDLADKVLAGFDFFRNAPVVDPAFVEPGSASYDNVAHGTHVAGIAAAMGDEVGVIGVGFHRSIELLPVKLFDDCGGSGKLDTLVKAIRWASGLPVAGAPSNENPADIINMSLGLPGHHPVLDAAAEEAWNSGVLLVAASGNNSTHVMSPANGPHVLAVGSVDQDRQRSDFSNYGAGLDVVAPGGFGTGADAETACALSGATTILSTVPSLQGGTPEQDYACFAGTSMAAPFVSGVAALIMAQDSSLSAVEVRQRILDSALFEPHMVSEEYGAGLVCADAAVGAPTQCGSL